MATAKVEQRSVFTEVRADETKFELHGVAASYNKLSRDLGGFREQIAPGAFDRSLRSGTDVKCLLNHDSNIVLGSSRAQTLTLESRADGLHMRCKLDRTSPNHASVFASVRRADISEMSFAFQADDDQWENDVLDPEDRSKRFTRRTLRSVQLLDVSPVCYAAYNNGATSVQARSRAEIRAAAAYIVTPPADVRPFTRAEADRMIDQLNRKRAAEVGAEIRTVTDDMADENLSADADDDTVECPKCGHEFSP
jgi:HK97 family phage prohead protease